MRQNRKSVGDRPSTIAVQYSPILERSVGDRVAQRRVRAGKRENSLAQDDEAKIGATGCAGPPLLPIDVTDFLRAKLPFGNERRPKYRSAVELVVPTNRTI